MTVDYGDSALNHPVAPWQPSCRMARVGGPLYPHHATQRGNGRLRTFVGDFDYALYRDLLAEYCDAAAGKQADCAALIRLPVARLAPNLQRP